MSQFSPTLLVSSNDAANPDTVALGTGGGTSYEISNCGKQSVFVMVNDGAAVEILPRSEGTVAAANNAVISKLEFYVASGRVRFQSLSPGALPPSKVVCKVEITKHS
jgi:hypothetical protein